MRIDLVLASVFIGAQLLIVSSILFPLNAAEAQRNIAYVASGSGSGTITCPNGDSAAATLRFGVTEYRNYRDITGTEGNYRIIAPQPVGEIQGVLTDGHVGAKSFRVTGSESFVGGCSTLISDVVISGKCGTDVTILYRAEDGVSGRFTGDVNCFTR